MRRRHGPWTTIWLKPLDLRASAPYLPKEILWKVQMLRPMAPAISSRLTRAPQLSPDRLGL